MPRPASPRRSLCRGRRPCASRLLRPVVARLISVPKRRRLLGELGRRGVRVGLEVSRWIRAHRIRHCRRHPSDARCRRRHRSGGRCRRLSRCGRIRSNRTLRSRTPEPGPELSSPPPSPPRSPSRSPSPLPGPELSLPGPELLVTAVAIATVASAAVVAGVVGGVVGGVASSVGVSSSVGVAVVRRRGVVRGCGVGDRRLDCGRGRGRSGRRTRCRSGRRRPGPVRRRCRPRRARCASWVFLQAFGGLVEPSGTTMEPRMADPPSSNGRSTCA